MEPSSNPTPNQVGKDYLRQTAKLVHDRLPDNHGFILLSFPFGTADGRLSYTSNASREDAIKVIKEWLFRIGQADDWMRHVK